MYAITHIAVHDALNAIHRRYRAVRLPRPGAAAHLGPCRRRHRRPRRAGRRTGRPADRVVPGRVRLCPGRHRPRRRRYAAALAAIPDRDGQDQRHQHRSGRSGSDRRLSAPATTPTMPPLVDTTPRGGPPGEYEFTPGTPFAFAPNWGAVTPFMLRDSTQFASGPPYPLTSRRYARDFDEVKRLGGGGEGDPTPSARTDEQTQIALFWVESSPLAWNRMARGIATDRRLDEWEAARLFGLLNMGDGRRLHRNVPREVQLQLLASGDRHPPRRRGRQPPHLAGPDCGSPSSGPRRSRTTTPDTASKVASPPRSCAASSAPTGSSFTRLQPDPAGGPDVR